MPDFTLMVSGCTGDMSSAPKAGSDATAATGGFSIGVVGVVGTGVDDGAADGLVAPDSADEPGVVPDEPVTVGVAWLLTGAVQPAATTEMTTADEMIRRANTGRRMGPAFHCTESTDRLPHRNRCVLSRMPLFQAGMPTKRRADLCQLRPRRVLLHRAARRSAGCRSGEGTSTMTSSLPAGDGLTSDAPAETALDENAAPETGSEPDTAPDAAGEGSTPAAHSGTELDGPALENPEMHRATEDLQSSEEKSAAAREIADDLAASTQPTT